jgi:hypothetical protein
MDIGSPSIGDGSARLPPHPDSSQASPAPSARPPFEKALGSGIYPDVTDSAVEGSAAPAHSTRAASLSGDLAEALRGGESQLVALTGRTPSDRRDRFLTLLAIYDLHTAPLDTIGPLARYQHHPVVAEFKGRCEAAWLDELDEITLPDDLAAQSDIVEVLRALAARDRLPSLYRWVAQQAGWDEIVHFLALEGGPDAGFDDLVAACQIGLTGSSKMELAVNYWDEMGNGDPAAVHTELHNDLVAAIGMPRIPLDRQTDAALARLAFGGLLATNRWMQPEMLGALGLIELQAGPRCRLVLQGFDRCGAPRDAYPFYEVHAEVDPRHGKDWLDKAIAPLVAERPEAAGRIIRGALWRSAINNAFLVDVAEELGASTDSATAEQKRSSARVGIAA